MPGVWRDWAHWTWSAKFFFHTRSIGKWKIFSSTWIFVVWKETSKLSPLSFLKTFLVISEKKCLILFFSLCHQNLLNELNIVQFFVCQYSHGYGLYYRVQFCKDSKMACQTKFTKFFSLNALFSLSVSAQCQSLWLLVHATTLFQDQLFFQPM